MFDEVFFTSKSSEEDVISKIIIIKHCCVCAWVQHSSDNGSFAYQLLSYYEADYTAEMHAHKTQMHANIHSHIYTAMHED